MNVHPLLVHFPIAFFVTYAVFELLRFKILTRQPYWFYIKAILVSLGVIGAIFAGISGQLIESRFTDRALISLHQHINFAASTIFAVITFAYVVRWLKITPGVKIDVVLGSLTKMSLSIEHIVLDTLLLYPLVILGLLLIMIGGALGGIIVYGPNLDPFTQFIYFLAKPFLK